MRGPAIETYLGSEAEGAGLPHETDTAVAVRDYLSAVRAYLGEIHRDGASGRAVNEAHSDHVDRLVRRLFQLSEEQFFADGGEGPSEICLMAVGGYARREMSLYSDVDLLFLYGGSLTPHVASVAERVQYWLWDGQLSVGGATRTISETIKLARKDTSVCTAVLAPRFLVGSGVLFHQFNQQLHSQLLAKPERLLSEFVVSLQERHTAFGDSLYLLQPNLKESAGGLRDYHASCWTMQASRSSVRGKEDFLHLGLLTEEEAERYFDGLDFLWRLRNELHLQVGRKHDQLSFEIQEKVAEVFGYGDDGGSELPVERFMRDYYRHARNISSYSSLVMEQCLARVRQRPRRRRIEQVERGLRIAGGQLEVPQARQLREDPLLLLDAFGVAQQHDVPLTRKARRLIRGNLQLIDDDFRTNPAAVESFMGIIRAERRVTRSLTVMNEIGVLGRFLPEWEHIVCRWQHVMYHTYTVDVHSIFLVEELRRLLMGDYADELGELTELMRTVEDPTAIYLGCLLHDIGKGLGGNHSSKGAVLARTCLERLGLDAELVDRAVFIVEYHLLMSHLAQSRDLSDPKLIVEFARTVGDRTNLRNLYLATVADVRASSKKAWTDWKGRLLRELFERTSEFLETGSDDVEKAVELIERRVEARQATASADLRKQGLDDGDVQLYFDMMPRRYFMAHQPPQIVRHAQVVLDFVKTDGTVATSVREMRGGFSELILCARDVHGLYANVAGVLTAHHLNILGSHVYTTRSGLALEVYRVATPEGGEAERTIAWQEFDRSVANVLEDKVGVSDLLSRRGRPVGAATTPSQKAVSVKIANEESDFYTIADVSANDRVGLLHDLTRVIADHGFEVYISKAATVLDQVVDTFYLKDHEGRKLRDDEAIARLEADLLAAARGETVG